MRAVVLVVGLADLALETGLDLSADTDTVANFTGRHFVANLDHFPNDFMTHANGQWAFAPAASDCMDVGAADTACFDLNVDVAILEWLRLELRKRSIDA